MKKPSKQQFRGFLYTLVGGFVIPLVFAWATAYLVSRFTLILVMPP